MLARRAPDAENPRFAPGQGQATPFLTRIGLRVLSDSFSVSDTPSLREFDGRPVAGAYVVDDEAVPAKDVTLVEKGRLVTLLTSRTPQKNLLQSNGHGRSGSVQAGVFQVRSTQAEPRRRRSRRSIWSCSRRRTRRIGYISAARRRAGRCRRRRPGGPIILEAVKVDARRQGRAGPRPPLREPSPRRRSETSSRPRRTRVLHNYRVDAGNGCVDHRPESHLRGARASEDARDQSRKTARSCPRPTGDGHTSAQPILILQHEDSGCRRRSHFAQSH